MTEILDACCSCTAIARILADNDPKNGTTAERVIRMTENVCNGCGGIRPAEPRSGAATGAA